jgi:predicted lipoprotein with Yx(FWY)xxD motif
MRLRITTALIALAVAALAAGCGSSSNGSSGSSGGGYGAPAPASTTKAASSSGATTVSTTKGELGTFLVDGQGRTLYLWEADTGSKSTCDGACAAAWPPVTTEGAGKAGGDAESSKLGTTKRSDGSTQVTYDGHPLYRFAGDSKPGQTAGQGSDGFGAEWYVVDPAGTAIDKD